MKVAVRSQKVKSRTSMDAADCMTITRNNLSDLHQYVDSASRNRSKPSKNKIRQIRLMHLNLKRPAGKLNTIRVAPKCQIEFKPEDWEFFYTNKKEESAIQKRFNELATQWKTETGGYSTVKQIVSNESYKYIIAMGPEVLPFIFNDLMKEPNYWFEALKFITQVEKDPVPDKYYGNIKKMSQYWLEWGRQNNYIK